MGLVTFLCASAFDCIFVGSSILAPAVWLQICPKRHGACSNVQWCWWLCRATSWLRPDWSWRSVLERWRMCFAGQFFQPGPRSTADGFRATWTKKGRKACTPPPCCTTGSASNVARAGHWGCCNPLLHLCYNRFVYCMELSQRSRVLNLWGRCCIGRSDTYSRCIFIGVHAPSPAKPGKLNSWQI